MVQYTVSIVHSTVYGSIQMHVGQQRQCDSTGCSGLVYTSSQYYVVENGIYASN